MDRIKSIPERIKVFAQKYALEKIGLDENIYRKVIEDELKKKPLSFRNWSTKL